VGVFRQALQFIMNILMDAYSDVFTDVSLRRIMYYVSLQGAHLLIKIQP
jgi:hypothetical protein